MSEIHCGGCRHAEVELMCAQIDVSARS